MEQYVGANVQSAQDAASQLSTDRQANDQRLKRRFERIFDKYSRDFDGIGDEIDIVTGDIVVNNGHLRSMRHEGDPGDRLSAQIFSAIVDNLKDESGGEDDEERSDDGDGTTEGLGSDEEREDHSDGSATDEPMGVDLICPEQAAVCGPEEPTSRLLSSDGHHVQQSHDRAWSPRSKTSPSIPDHYGATSTSSTSLDPELGTSLRYTAEKSKPASFFLQQYMEILKNGFDKHGDRDPDAVQALGQSIANQIAQFLQTAGSSHSRATVKERTLDPAWEYPELPVETLLRPSECLPRRLAAQPVSTESSLASFDGPSISSSNPYPRPMKRRRKTNDRLDSRKLSAQIEEEGAESCPSENESAADFRELSSAQQVLCGAPDESQCANCGSESMRYSRRSPFGRLCNACFIYWNRYGLKRYPGGDLRVHRQWRQSDLLPCPGVKQSTTKSGIDGNEQTPTSAEPSNDEVLKPPRQPSAGDYAANTCRRLGRVAPNKHLKLRFTLQEDMLLIKLRQIDRLRWTQVAEHFPTRGLHGLQYRYYHRESNGVMEDAYPALRAQGYDVQASGAKEKTSEKVEGKRFANQDQLLTALREEDKLDWEGIADRLPGRTAVWVEARYKNIRGNIDLASPVSREDNRAQTTSLDDPHKRLPDASVEAINQDQPSSRCKIGLDNIHYSKDEDDLIERLREAGLSWRQIASQMPGHDALNVSRHWKAMEKARLSSRASCVSSDAQVGKVADSLDGQAQMHQSVQSSRLRRRSATIAPGNYYDTIADRLDEYCVDYEAGGRGNAAPAKVDEKVLDGTSSKHAKDANKMPTWPSKACPNLREHDKAIRTSTDANDQHEEGTTQTTDTSSELRSSSNSNTPNIPRKKVSPRGVCMASLNSSKVVGSAKSHDGFDGTRYHWPKVVVEVPPRRPVTPASDSRQAVESSAIFMQAGRRTPSEQRTEKQRGINTDTMTTERKCQAAIDARERSGKSPRRLISTPVREIEDSDEDELA